MTLCDKTHRNDIWPLYNTTGEVYINQCDSEYLSPTQYNLV